MAVDRIKELVQEGLRRKLSGDLTGAAVAWSEALALDPGNARAREGLEALMASGAAAAAPLKRNPFARPETAPVTTTPSPFSGLPANSTPLAMVIPPAAAASKDGAAGTPAPPSPGTMVFGLGATPPAGLPAPPSAGTMVFGLGATPPAGLPAPPSSTMVFGLEGAPPAAPSTLVFGMDSPPPGAALPPEGPAQTMVFGLAPDAGPADPAAFPAPAPTMPFGVPAGVPLPAGPSVVELPAAAAVVSLPPGAPTLAFGQEAAGQEAAGQEAAGQGPGVPGGGVADAALESMDLGALAVPPAPAEDAEISFDFPVEEPTSPAADDLPFDVDEEPEPAAAPAAPPPAATEPEPEEEPDAGTLLLKATDLLDLDDYSGAMAAVEKVLGLEPENATARELKARCEATLLAMYESKLGDLTRRPALRLKPDEIVWLNLDHRAGFLLSMIDGQVSYDDLFALSSMGRMETARILAQLVADKVVG